MFGHDGAHGGGEDLSFGIRIGRIEVAGADRGVGRVIAAAGSRLVIVVGLRRRPRPVLLLFPLGLYRQIFPVPLFLSG